MSTLWLLTEIDSDLCEIRYFDGLRTGSKGQKMSRTDSKSRSETRHQKKGIFTTFDLGILEFQDSLKIFHNSLLQR